MENAYEAGAMMASRDMPSRKLVINRYYKRIYYCHIVGDDTKKLLAYFEKELMPFK